MIVSAFVILGYVPFLLYAVKMVEPSYHVWPLEYDHVNVGMLFRLATFWVNILSHFRLYKTIERMRVNHVLVPLPFHRMAEDD